MNIKSVNEVNEGEISAFLSEYHCRRSYHRNIKKKKTTSKPKANVNCITTKRIEAEGEVIGLQPPTPRVFEKLSVCLNRMFFNIE